MIQSSQNLQLIRSKSPTSSAHYSLPLFLRSRDQDIGKTHRDTGPLPSLRELVGEHKSVLTFRQSKVMGGCELVDFGLSINNNKSVDETRVDVDLALIGLRPEQLRSRIFSTKSESVHQVISVMPTMTNITLSSLPQASSMKEEIEVNGCQNNFHDYCRPQDHDLFAVGYTLNDNVVAQPTVDINSHSTDHLTDSSLQYFDLDTFQNEIDLPEQRSKHEFDVNGNAVTAMQQVQKIVRKRKTDRMAAERNIICSHCPRKFRSVGHLKVHFNSAHSSDGSIRKCHCEVCGRSFCHKGALALHKRRHNPQKDNHIIDNKRMKLARLVEIGDQLVPQEFYL